jgi:hypothetical protein
MVVPIALTLPVHLSGEVARRYPPPPESKQNNVMPYLVEKQQYENIHNLLAVVLKTCNIPR